MLQLVTSNYFSVLYYNSGDLNIVLVWYLNRHSNTGHLKTGQICPVFKWSTNLDHFFHKRKYFLCEKESYLLLTYWQFKHFILHRPRVHWSLKYFFGAKYQLKRDLHGVKSAQTTAPKIALA
jgi:hypothetical protein